MSGIMPGRTGVDAYGTEGRDTDGIMDFCIGTVAELTARGLLGAAPRRGPLPQL
ncbi:hypothetical protein Cme02nite_06760 [Catellatospora methionotrophica]|uniref:Uncharacterized protein n=1 Tax=Catellatospora methionotrophica TaxID=121620 RepID=A0A8J3L6C7_9ACTN|nr:hypothetical protein [Catellatospora methionotrophica]GIG12344.1 hypothetical protein Cme02nite_06760 [Catellatospora methionotrophica]